MKILVTGAAGFIGSHLCKFLLNTNRVVGIDNLNDYYDPNLKKARLNWIDNKNFKFYKIDINDPSLSEIFKRYQFDIVINLAAQAGVRYSIENPSAYIDSNITGFLNILELCKKYKIKHLLYASSSSVYGINSKKPFSENDKVDKPISLYAATKKTNELMAHTYSHMFGMSVTGLRFFTVYGPWGRPDMALFKFVSNIIKDKPIDVYNNGEMERDFTYIDDVIEGINKILQSTIINSTEIKKNTPPYFIYNIGNNNPCSLMNFIRQIELSLNKKAIINYQPLQLGDVSSTYADISLLKENMGYEPQMSIASGVQMFTNWFKSYYKI